MLDKIEIMAPVGSFETFNAAIKAGADSVYFGVGKLNMRARSTINFGPEDLPEIVETARKNNVKTYLTVNTILYDDEIKSAHELVDAAAEAGIDAIIASDISIITYAAKKGVEIHISTQVNISNFEEVKYYAQYADVMVTARELNLNQVKYITDKIKEENITGPGGNLIRIEIFAHGALCMAVSGKCYLSLHEQDYSANRGSCLQTCRKAYVVTEKESGYELEVDNEYIMSPKDLKTIHFLNKILDAGVRVLKIEGRARSPEYVYTVTKTYKEAVEAYNSGTYNKENIKEWEIALSSVFNRGFWDGYYLGQKLGEWSHRYGNRAKYRKVYLGKCQNFFSKISVAEFKIETGELSTGDKVYIIGPTTGLIELDIDEIRVDEKPVEKTQKGDYCSFKVPEFLRRSDKLYKVVKEEDVRIQ